MEVRSTILLVDDDHFARSLMGELLESDGHRVIHAPDGESGLRIAKSDPPDLVFIDLDMPGIDGCETTLLMRQDPVLSEIPIFMLSAIDEREAKIRAIESGADEYIMKPFDWDEISARARVTTRLNRYRKLQEAQRAMQTLAMAAKVQQHLLPKSSPVVEGFEIASGSRYCESMGGDYFDFIQISKNNLGIAVGDISGHGVVAALLMASAQAMLRTTSRYFGQNPSELLGELNRELMPTLGESRFLTLFYATVHTPNRHLSWASAGHEPALWYRAREQKIQRLDSTGLPLGILMEEEYAHGGTIELLPGDVLQIGTDGIIESQSPDGKAFGRQRLENLVTGNADKSAREIYDAIINDVDAYRGKSDQQDDITLLVLKAV
jgi:sigma-B regulation protein RsbU (phosphoserine phosphatase)